MRPERNACGSVNAGRREWSGLSVLVLAVLLLRIDSTVLSLAVPSLSADLAPSPTQLLWIADVHSFALAGPLVTMGNVGDRVGRKRLLIVGAAVFGVASLLAAFAPTAGWLIAARVLLGVAGATLMPSTLSLIRNLFHDGRQRTTAIAIWAAAATVGAAVGPLVGGVLLEHFWCGSVFLINLPVMAVLLVVGPVLLPESRNSQPGAFDLLSAALSVVAVIAPVFAVKRAAEGVDVTAVGALLVGSAAAALFVHRQRRTSTPLLDITLFRRPVFAGAVGANLLSMLALSGLVFLLSQYFQMVRGLSPGDAGLWQSPLSLASVVTTFLVGAIAFRLGRGRAIGVGLLVAAGGVGAVAAATGNADFTVLSTVLAAVGFGVGLALTLTTPTRCSPPCPPTGPARRRRFPKPPTSWVLHSVSRCWARCTQRCTARRCSCPHRPPMARSQRHCASRYRRP
ncbi:MFS transporter [Mycolicibacterium arenosum]|uniref:MFS transporter n=1 Tax=Mycolicibacterium arenosum TaxID=2952157 RepID=A0ABT1M038_9MYCO|nr:MFS transporter [Mycolicibacterium sp. CAU 1645]MCP9272515.1 MFS transporter [Mycolicibacterium sp. CAU 1645]